MGKLRVNITQHPTQRVDNTPFTLAQWNVKYTKSGQGAYTQGPMLTANDTVFEIPGVTLGETWTAFVQWYDSDGQMSVKMLSADPVVAPPPPPLPPLPKSGDATMVYVP